MNSIVKASSDQIMHAGRPQHVHQCAGDEDGKTAHTWMCDSQYGEFMADFCTHHGGLPPIRIGREPWRGR
jgi:hypothetical protein